MTWQDPAPGDAGSRRGDVIEDGAVRVYAWEWGEVAGRRSGVPWIGVFLLVFGGLLLLGQVLPQFRVAGSAVVLAVGVAFLVKWALERGIGSLYAGAIITALGAPPVIEASGIARGDGLGTLCLGLAFLGIAAVRATSGSGVGWQAYLGVILAAIGGAQVLIPALGGILVPALVIGVGLLLVLRSMRPGTAQRR